MQNLGTHDYVVVGAGFFGATVAERLAAHGKKVLVVERRRHVAGNAYSRRDRKSGIEIHEYGSHIFHTEDEIVWDYITRFTDFNGYIHTVPTRHKGELYPMPINLDTINKLYGLEMSPEEAEQFVAEEAAKTGITNPKNFDEKGRSLVGDKLYETFLKNYTEKQWNTSASNLSAEILKRIPVRFNKNNHYFQSAAHQGIPVKGYTQIVKKMLDHPNIELLLNTNFKDIADQIPDDTTVIYCGQVDELLDYQLGVLPYRSLKFKTKWINEKSNQPAALDSKLGHTVINEADPDVPYTRSHYYKYYQIHQPEVLKQPRSLVCYEYPANFEKGGEAYYPVNNAESAQLYDEYVALLKKTHPNYILGGRLGAYCYWDMDVAIRHALDLASHLIHQDSKMSSLDREQLVSIIIPVYNCELYLADCLKSIAAQTYQNFEVILVDDASTDRSPVICDDFVARDPRFQVIHRRRNAGAAAARNTGIQAAQGAYLSFVDSDDLVEKEFIATLHSAITKTNSDIAVCNFSDDGELQPTPHGFTSGVNACRRLLTRQDNLDIVIWNKIYRASIFNEIHFAPTRAFEDNFTLYQCYLAARTIVYVDDMLYHHITRPHSVMSDATAQDRLSAHLQSAKDAQEYITRFCGWEGTDLQSAAVFAEALAEFGFIDASLRSEVPRSMFHTHRKAILNMASELKGNVHCTRRVRWYLRFLRPLGGLPYRIFRFLTNYAMNVDFGQSPAEATAEEALAEAAEK